MATFVYKVRDRTGKAFTGNMEGENRGVVASRLQEMDYFITSISEKKKNILFSNQTTLFQNIKLRDLTIFYRQFATMVNAGLTLVNSLDILTKQVENKALSDIIKIVKSDIEAGFTLANAMAKHPQVFSELYISMVRAGEVGGVLDEILKKIADLICYGLSFFCNWCCSTNGYLYVNLYFAPVCRSVCSVWRRTPRPYSVFYNLNLFI